MCERLSSLGFNSSGILSDSSDIIRDVFDESHCMSFMSFSKLDTFEGGLCTARLEILVPIVDLR